MAIGAAQTLLTDIADNKKVDTDWQTYVANSVAGGIGGAFLLSSVNGYLVAGLVSFGGMLVEHGLKQEAPGWDDVGKSTIQTIAGGLLGQLYGTLVPRGVGSNPSTIAKLFGGVVGPNKIRADNFASWISTLLLSGFQKAYDNSQKLNNNHGN